MSQTDAKQIIEKLLKYADIKVNGSRPWDIQVYNNQLFTRVLSEGSIGLGESYMEGWWDCKALDQFFYKLLSSKANKKMKLDVKTALVFLQNKLVNLQTKSGSLKVAREHYDLSNELYMSFLDPYNQYTCGYFKDTKDLNKAQEQKLNLICRKLQLKKTDKVLDIGCGWGGFAKYASEHYGCHVTGISISKEQIKYAKEFTKGLPVTILEKDYRDIKGKFDKILVCGMIEHVGHKNYKTIMKKVSEVLSDEGIFLLHTIGTNNPQGTLEPWINKYIFPNSQLPTMESLTRNFESLFIVEDWHNFGVYYDPTLMAWYKNFQKNWFKFQNQYDEKFFRMFKYYLLCCAGSFRARDNQLWQIVMTKNGIPDGYQSVR